MTNFIASVIFIYEFISINIIFYGFFSIIYWYTPFNNSGLSELLTKLNVIKVMAGPSAFVQVFSWDIPINERLFNIF